MGRGGWANRCKVPDDYWLSAFCPHGTNDRGDRGDSAVALLEFFPPAGSPQFYKLNQGYA